jgi:hypothetical protein
MKKNKSTTAKIAIEPPLFYESLKRAPTAAPGAKKAVLINHGMGQQTEFETLDQAVTGLRRAAEKRGDKVQEKVRFVQIGDERLYRVELEIHTREKVQQVDLYESYWAPLTEGEVSLRDVVWFLSNAGIAGMLKYFQSPIQTRFGQRIPMALARRTLKLLVLALAILFSLIVMNASIVAVGAAQSVFVPASTWLSETLFHNLSVIFNILLIFVIPLGGLLLLASVRKAAGGPAASVGAFARGLIWGFLLLTMTATLLLGLENVGALVAARSEPVNELVARLFPGGDFLADVRAGATALGLLAVVLVSVGSWCRPFLAGTSVAYRLLLATCLLGQGYGLLSVLAQFNHDLLPVVHAVSTTLFPVRWTLLRWPLWLWPFLVLAAAQIRAVLVQYVGDVAAYVSPDKLDRFNEIRGKIKDQARRAASAIYSAQQLKSDGFEYSRIALVGHSLGSVISYDTLNRLLKDDEIGVNALDVLGRTRLLLTFGSPLDKTSFVFALHGSKATETREALVTAVQPLVQDYRYRPFPWVNIWSPHDVISGELNYFDTEPPDPRYGVKNERDPEATIPLVAHTEYWRNELVWERLYAALV